MRTASLMFVLALALSACEDQMSTAPDASEAGGVPSLSADHTGRNTVVVNPDASGNGVAATITEALGMVEDGGTIRITPGRYEEALLLTHGVTLTSMSPGAGEVVLASPAGAQTAIEVATTSPVTIEGIQIEALGFWGIRGLGAVDVTVDQVDVSGPLFQGIIVQNDATASGGVAQMTVRGSRVDLAGAPHTSTFGIYGFGDVLGTIVGNVVRHTRFVCIELRTRADGGGSLNGEITGNDVDDCGVTGGIRVGSGFSVATPLPFTATGVVNVVGNLVQNSTGSCLLRTGINFEVLTGRIEHNKVANVVQGCTTPNARAMPAGIWVGSRIAPHGAATPVVRFNDLTGNAFAGLRLAPNETVQLDASCNWFGDGTGPSGIGGGSGDALLVEPGAALPTYTPFATAPIAGTGATGC